MPLPSFLSPYSRLLWKSLLLPFWSMKRKPCTAEQSGTHCSKALMLWWRSYGFSFTSSPLPDGQMTVSVLVSGSGLLCTCRCWLCIQSFRIPTHQRLHGLWGSEPVPVSTSSFEWGGKQQLLCREAWHEDGLNRVGLASSTTTATRMCLCALDMLGSWKKVNMQQNWGFWGSWGIKMLPSWMD